MYGYEYVLVSRGLDNQRRSPYHFEPGEPEDRTRAAGKYGVISAIAAYALVIAIVMALSIIVGTDQPGQHQNVIRIEPSVARFV